MMSNTATFTLHTSNWVLRVPDAGALFRTGTLEVSCHSLIRVLLPAQKSVEGKRHTSYRRYSTNVYIQNRWSTTLKQLGKTTQTQIIHPPEMTWTLYNYIYLEDKTTYGAKYTWYDAAQNKNQKPCKTWNTVCYRVPNKNPAQSLQENKITVFGPRLYNSLPKCLPSSTNFWNSFRMSPKCPTMSPRQVATASSTSSLIAGRKESTTAAESPNWQRSRLNCFETTPSISE